MIYFFRKGTVIKVQKPIDQLGIAIEVIESISNWFISVLTIYFTVQVKVNFKHRNSGGTLLIYLIYKYTLNIFNLNDISFVLKYACYSCYETKMGIILILINDY